MRPGDRFATEEEVAAVLPGIMARNATLLARLADHDGPERDAGTIPDPSAHPFFTVADPVPPPRRFFGPALAVWVTVWLVCSVCVAAACVALWRLAA